jgi:hypothetical protein
MKKLILIIIVNISFSQVVSDYSYIGAKATALSGSMVANKGDVNSVFHNPAGLTEIESNELSVGFTNIFNLSFLPFSHFAISLNVSQVGTFGFSVQEMSVNYGDNTLSSEQNIGLSHGIYIQKDRNSKLSFGYTLHFLDWNLGKSAGQSGDGSDGLTSGSLSAIGVDIGLLAVLRDKYRVGVCMTNVNSPEIGRGMSSQPLPRKINAGISLIPYQNVVTSLALERTLGQKDKQIKAGVEYTLNQFVLFRVGTQSNPNRIGVGLELHMVGVNFSYGILSHPTLPITHQYNIGYRF